MQLLAMELGRSLLFPVTCRYCGCSIWLFASRDGGFAIFDRVGVPWPKHVCWGVRETDPRYVHTTPEFSRLFEHFPVPAAVPIADPAAGQRVVGVVVRRDREPDLLGACQVIVLTERIAYRVWSATPISLGTPIEGVARGIRDSWWLEGVRHLPLPDPAPAEAAGLGATKPALPTPVGSLSAEMIWRIQEDAASLRRHKAPEAEAIEVAIEALIADKPLAAAAGLAAAVLRPAKPFSRDMTDRHVQALFLTLRDLHLEVLAPSIGNSMSDLALRAVGARTLSLVREVTSLGRLKRQKQSRETLSQIFMRGLREEQSFLDSLKAQFPMAWEYVTDLQEMVAAHA